MLQGLYAITMPDNFLLKKVELAIQGGAKIIQYRDKTTNTRQRLEDATAIKKLCEKHQVIFIINDDIQLALASKADGVHLGKTDSAISQAREQLGTKAIIGTSCYDDVLTAKKAEEAGANYVAFGRFFRSKSKPNAPPASINILNKAKQELSIPVVAIGGITPDNGAQLIKAGADMLAVINAVFDYDDVKTQAQQLTNLF